MAEVTDFRKAWKKEKRKKRFLQFVALLVSLVLVLLLVANWNEISSYFVLPDPASSLDRTVGNLPATLDGEKIYQFLSDDKRLLVVEDTVAARYPAELKTYQRYTHTLTDPRADMEGIWTVLYTLGGSKAMLYREDRQKWEWTGSDRLLTAAVSSAGNVALASCSGLYSSRLTVYDQNRKQLFFLDTDEQITALTFAKTGKNLAMATVRTESGKLVSVLRQLHLNRTKADWSVSLPDQWILGLSYTSEGGVMVVCSGGVYLFDANGKELAHREYPSDLLAVAHDGSYMIFAIASPDPEKSHVVWLNDAFETVADLTVEGECRSLSLGGKESVIVTEKVILRLNEQGAVRSYAFDETVRYAACLRGKMVGVSDDHIFLLEEKAA